MPDNDQPKESLFGAAVKAAMSDGALAAFWRQGLGELGQALKAFPESIQVHELGTIGSPTPGEIAQGRVPGNDSDQESLYGKAQAAGPAEQDQSQGMERGGR